jgi:hypothetical protein
VATKTQPMITRLSACSAGYIFRLLLFSNQTGSAVGCVPETRKKKTGVNLISIARKEVRHVASRPTTTHIRYIVTSYPAAAAAGPFFSPSSLHFAFELTQGVSSLLVPPLVSLKANLLHQTLYGHVRAKGGVRSYKERKRHSGRSISVTTWTLCGRL